MLALANHPQVDRRANRRGDHHAYQIVAIAHGFAVDGDDDVFFLDSSLLGRSAGGHAGDKNALGNAGDLEVGPRIARIGAVLNADGTARHLAVLDDLVVDLRRGVDGQGETDALVPPRGGGDGRVDANHFAANVQQRAAAIAGVDGRIGLKEVLILGAAAVGDVASRGADDAGGHGILKVERRPDGHRPVSHLHRIGIADLSRDNVGLPLDADHRQIGLVVHADDFGVIGGRIAGEFHFDGVGLIDHVVIRQDVTGAVHYNAGTQRLAALRARHFRPATEGVAEELEKLLESVAAVAVAVALVARGRDCPAPVPGLRGSLRQILYRNVHHRGLYLFRNL